MVQIEGVLKVPLPDCPLSLAPDFVGTGKVDRFNLCGPPTFSLEFQEGKHYGTSLLPSQLSKEVSSHLFPQHSAKVDPAELNEGFWQGSKWSAASGLAWELENLLPSPSLIVR